VRDKKAKKVCGTGEKDTQERKGVKDIQEKQKAGNKRSGKSMRDEQKSMGDKRSGKDTRDRQEGIHNEQKGEDMRDRRSGEDGREILIGRKNNVFQHIVVLKTNRYKRREYGEFFVEGVRNINLAVKNGWRIKNWIYSERELSGWAKSKIASVKTEKNYRLSEDLMAEISDKTDKSELLAIVEMRETKVERSDNFFAAGKMNDRKAEMREAKVKRSDNSVAAEIKGGKAELSATAEIQEIEIKRSDKPFILLVDRPSKKGNLGSIIRSADAFGCDGVIVTGHSVDVYDPEVISASMGSFFSVDIEKIDENSNLIGKIDKLKEKYADMKIVAATERGDGEIRDGDFRAPILLLIGNESEGLSKFFLDICDCKVKIPMVGQASSLNVACATSIFLYEIFSQRNG
jgi:TrmH family RNA methyltransferase